MSASSGESMPSINFNLPHPEFVDPKAKENRICPVCRNILYQPMQTACGHRMCENCLEHLLTHKKSIPCPVGEEDCVILSKEERTVIPDFGGRKDLKKLLVYCSFRKYGCKEKMLWAKLEDHLQTCPHAVKECSYRIYGCEEMIKISDFQDHIISCPYHPEACQFCKKMIAKCKLKSHIDDECPKASVTCPDCKMNGFQRSEFEKHQKTCSSKQSTCSYKNIGCSFMGNMADLEEHEKVCIMEHLDLHVKYTQTLTIENQDLDRRLKVVEADRDELKSGINKLTIENQNLRKKVGHTEYEMKQLQRIVAGNTEKTNKLEENVKSLAKKDDVTAQNLEMDSLKSNFHELESRMTSLQSMDSGYSSAGLSSDVSQHDRLLSLFNVRLAEVDLRLQMLETASYNGVLMWKIRGYNRRKAEARSGKTISLYSQPFYTSPQGYKMCARVYLNGDGIGKGSHLSLFFVVMKGDYDALLPWPFRQKVSLMLLDQVGNRHLQDTFRPDPGSSSFQKPQNEMNVASGCPLFVAHTVLEANGTPYIRDETIFIKVVVDSEGLEEH